MTHASYSRPLSTLFVLHQLKDGKPHTLVSMQRGGHPPLSFLREAAEQLEYYGLIQKAGPRLSGYQLKPVAEKGLDTDIDNDLKSRVLEHVNRCRTALALAKELNITRGQVEAVLQAALTAHQIQCVYIGHLALYERCA